MIYLTTTKNRQVAINPYFITHIVGHGDTRMVDDKEVHYTSIMFRDKDSLIVIESFEEVMLKMPSTL